MDDKMVKLGIAIMGLGGVWLGNLYGKVMYAKGFADADNFYKPILKADKEIIDVVLNKLKKQEGSH